MNFEVLVAFIVGFCILNSRSGGYILLFLPRSESWQELYTPEDWEEGEDEFPLYSWKHSFFQKCFVIFIVQILNSFC